VGADCQDHCHPGFQLLKRGCSAMLCAGRSVEAMSCDGRLATGLRAMSMVDKLMCNIHEDRVVWFNENAD
jgi:hypothetical protein